MKFTKLELVEIFSAYEALTEYASIMIASSAEGLIEVDDDISSELRNIEYTLGKVTFNLRQKLKELTKE